jgi:hypothetical protein
VQGGGEGVGLACLAVFAAEGNVLFVVTDCSILTYRWVARA